MHKGQLSVMFVGGPNTRKDFHLEEGSEFFYQMRGDMELPTVQQGKQKLVKIKQGQVFCLPSRIPHSPQRPNTGSFGLVIERQRQASEMDGLVWYKDFEKCDAVLWERFFRCEDLGKDLPPVIKAFKEFEASAEAKKPQSWPEENRPLRQDVKTAVPPPFFLEDFLLANQEKLSSGEVLPLFAQDHPDRECKVMVAGGPSEQSGHVWTGETWLYQLRGQAHIAVRHGTLTLEEGCCCIVNPNMSYDVSRASGSLGLTVRMDPQGNRPSGQSDAPAPAPAPAAVAPLIGGRLSERGGE